MKRIRFYLLVVENYWPGAAAIIQSIRDFSGLEPDLYEWRIYGDRVEEAERWAHHRPERIEIRPGDDLGNFPVQGHFKDDRFRHCFSKLGLWNLPIEANVQHVCLDADMICVGPIRELAGFPPFTAASKPLTWTEAEAEGTEISGGLWVIEPDPSVWNRLVEQYVADPSRFSDLAELDLLNNSCLFDNTPRLTSDWNFANRFTRTHGKSLWYHPPRPIRFLHFLGNKPWWQTHSLRNLSDSGYWFLEKHWWRAYHRSGFNRFLEKPLSARDCWAKSHLSPWTPHGVIWDALRQSLIGRSWRKMRSRIGA